MIKPILSIIIINWNTSAITLDCLRSINADKGLTLNFDKVDTSSKVPTEIIVVDNNSTDNSVSEIKKLTFPVKIVVNSDNLGFGKANNQALNLAQGNYVLLLNTDTIILHSAISQSINWLSSHPEACGCTAQLLNADHSIQASGGYFPNLANITTWCLGLDDLPFINSLIKPFHPHTPNFYTHDSFYLKDHPQDWLTGAFLLLRKPAMEKVSGFDPEFFMYGEEMEMCYRIKRQFPYKQFWYLVGPQIIHLGGASTKVKQSIYDREYQGIQFFFSKHRPKFESNIVSVLLKINRFLRTTIYQLFKHA